MHDDSILVAIDAALRSPASCACGRDLTIALHDGAAWLECVVFASPSRLPARLVARLRPLVHDRRFVIEAPARTTGRRVASRSRPRGPRAAPREPALR